MAFTAADLDKINTALASGTTKVRFGDREISYQSVSEMLKAKAQIERELAALAGSTAEYRADRRFADFHRGFDET